MAVISGSESMTNPASVAPKCTALAAEKPDPETVTAVPPAGGPALGPIALTTDTGT